MTIPVKPNDVTFTDEQWRAIWAKGSDMLVSAAAGSGKTKVLITRMIEKVLDENDPIDVDQLLVVTFTNAAAAEMRQRMGDALNVEIEKNPESAHLRRQLNLLNKAQISTLHSFCQSVVRQYAYLLDIDPGFRVADSAEAALLKDDAIGEVLENAYRAMNPEEMYRLADRFTNDRNDQLIETLVNRLYDYSKVHPQPTKWLRQIPAQYDVQAVQSVDDLPFIETIKKSIQYTLEEAIAQLAEMRRISKMPDGPEPLVETAEIDMQWIDEAYRLLTTGSWEDLYVYFQTLEWTRAKAIRKDSCDELLKKRAQKIRDLVKKMINDLKDDFFSRSPQRLLDEISMMAPSMHLLVELVEQFDQVYKQMKVERGIVDFSDLEHYALQILAIEKNGQLQASDIALNYRKQFAEVLVDEYQDINALQETIINLVKSGDEADGNLFMVGDVKQSIYGFRLAEPNLFLQKYERFTNDGQNTGLKIDLNANFRSRKEVLDASNFIFSQIMGVRVGGIAYDDAAALKYGARYPEKELATKLTIIYEEEEDEQSRYEEELVGQSLKNSELEAQYIIQQIQQLMKSGAEVTEAFSNKKRPLAYKDIVILLRSTTWSNEIVEQFKQAGIPVYAELSTGYFEAIEVMIMLNTLRIIDNPYQDIPLVSVLRSPFIGMTENELAQIRLTNRKEPFFEAVARFVKTGHEGIRRETYEKLQRFFIHFNEWRNLARHGSLSSLIWQVYTDTYYYEMVGAMPNGKQRQANLRMLHDRAIDYEKTSFRGLFRFLRFIDRMKKRGDDFGEAKSMSDQEDVVRLMTIHSSKGLEFPYVFIAGLGREFNKSDIRQSYIFDQDFGLAVKAIDPEKRITFSSLPFLAMKEKKELEMRAEEMRVLYVAMTRAKEYLSLVGSVKEIEKEISKWQEAQLIDPTLMLADYIRSKANSYLDWIGPAIARHQTFERFDVIPGGRLIQDDSLWDVQMLAASTIVVDESQASEQTKEDETSSTFDAYHIDKVRSRFEWTYPFASSILKRSKQTVSELKRLSILEEEDGAGWSEMTAGKGEVYLHDRPAFMQKRRLSPAEIGTAMHTVMQHISFQEHPSIDTINELVTSLVNRQLLTEEEGRTLHRKAIVQFLNTDLAHRLRIAQTVYREMPFTYALKENGDAQIVQGIVDCLFEEADGWVIVDYKTDYIDPLRSDEWVQAEMENRYRTQLNLYKRAVQSILGISIKEMLLYLFHSGGHISISEDNHL